TAPVLCGRLVATISGATCRAGPSSRTPSNRPPVRKRPGTSESTSTTTSPCTPCGRNTRPTATVSGRSSRSRLAASGPSVFEDFELIARTPAVLTGLQQRAHRPGRPTLAAHHLAEVGGSDPELQDAPSAPVRDLLDLVLIGLVHQQPGELLEVVHELGHAQALFFFVCWTSFWTVGDSRAPRPTQ